MLEHACHLPRGRRHTGNRHYRMTINLQDLVRTIVYNGVTRSRTAISCNENAGGKFECKNRGRLSRLAHLLLHRVLRYRTDGRRAEETFASQQRRKVIRCTREILVKSQL